MFTTLIIGLIAGPAVSLYGSPTVSPVTEAAWANEPLPPRFPSSINFLALSHAPPPEVIAMATNNPVTIVPTSKPPKTTGPSGLMSRFRLQLPAHFTHDRARSFANRIHAKCGENEWQQTAEKEANDHFRFCERKMKFGVSNVMRPQFLDIRSEKNQRGQSRRRDRITLRNSFHRVANGIELVGNHAHLFWQIAHHCYAAGVVGDRSERIERDDNSRHR